MTTVVKEFGELHVDMAARAMKSMKDCGGDPLDAQLAIAVMCMYLCDTKQIDGDSFLAHIRQNMGAMNDNPFALEKMLNSVHKHMTTTSIFLN